MLKLSRLKGEHPDDNAQNCKSGRETIQVQLNIQWVTSVIMIFICALGCWYGNRVSPYSQACNEQTRLVLKVQSLFTCKQAFTQDKVRACHMQARHDWYIITLIIKHRDHADTSYIHYIITATTPTLKGYVNRFTFGKQIYHTTSDSLQWDCLL